MKAVKAKCKEGKKYKEYIMRGINS